MTHFLIEIEIRVVVKYCFFFICRQYIGEHIRCITGGSIPEHVINTFCFFTTTFTVVCVPPVHCLVIFIYLFFSQMIKRLYCMRKLIAI